MGLARIHLGRIFCSLAALAVGLNGTFAAPLPSERAWVEQVAPVLDRHCYKCHGGVRQRGGLDARSLENLLKGGDSGPALIPGDPDHSNVFTFLHPDADTHMPPKKQLEEGEIAVLKRWIASLPTPEAMGLAREDAAWRTNYPVKLAAMRQALWTPPADLPPSGAIDNFIELGWRERKLRGAGAAPDQAFARRVYLDLIGRIPTTAELEAWASDASAERRAKLVDALLASDEYPRHMREVFDVVLMERKGARGESQRKENRWFDFLEQSFRANRPWNEIVRDIVVARPGETNRGAAWFLYERRNNHQAMAEAIAPVAFGVQIGCAQCHNHPLAWEIEQRHYWGLVAAFNRSKNVEASDGNGVAESAIGGFVNFENLKKEAQPALLAFLNGRSVPEPRPGDGEKEKDDPELYLVAPPAEKEKAKTPAVPKFSRREALAEVVTDENPRLARALVNRIWAMLLGRGLVHPVDRLDSRHPPSHPDLLDWLAGDFERNGYDVKRLIRQIVLSRVYQLDSRPAPGENPPPQAFARAIEKPLSAEQLFRSFLVATGHQMDGDGKIAGHTEAELRRAFIERFPDLFPEEYNASLQQATFVTNSRLVDSLLDRASGNTTDRLLALGNPNAQAVEAFRVAFGREPAQDELTHALALLQRRTGERGVKDLLWALLASAEFQLNH